MRKIGFFGGTFDPIHNGHLNLAIQLLEARHLDEVLFCPAFRSPFKETHIAAPHHRIEMVRLAIEEISRFRMCTWEIGNEAVSYTVDTLRELVSKEKARFHLLLSEDALADFHRWKEPEEIVRLAPPLIGSRFGAQAKIPPSPVAAVLKAGLVQTQIMDISSTDIRARLKKKLYCGHLVPAKALEYLQRHSLY